MAVCRSKSGVFRFLVLAKANKNNIVVRQALKDNAFFDTFVGNGCVNPSAEQVVPDLICRLAFFGK